MESITRRDFGRLALVGAGSLLLADGLTILPHDAYAAPTVVKTDWPALAAFDQSKNGGHFSARIIRARLTEANRTVKFTSNVFSQVGGDIVYQGPHTNRAYDTNVLETRYSNAVYLGDGEWGDLLINFTQVELQSHPDVGDVYGSSSISAEAVRVGSVDGLGISSDYWADKSNFDYRYPGTRIRVRVRVVKAGTTTLVPNVSMGIGCYDLDNIDKLNYVAGGPYAEAVTMLSNCDTSRVYFATDTDLRTNDANKIFCAEDHRNSGDPVNASFRVSNDATFDWTASGAYSGFSIDYPWGATVFEDVQWTPTATKVLDLGLKSGESTSRRLQANEFTFELRDESGRLLQTKKNATDGSVKFDAINLGTIGDIDSARSTKYTITELAGSDSKIDYDARTATVTVTLNPDGTVTETWSGSKTFTNVYHPEGNVTVKKVAKQPQLFS